MPYITDPFSYSFTIDENSYAIAGDLSEIPVANGEGMPVGFSGTSLGGIDCATNLSATSVSVNNTGVTVTITPAQAGSYEGCKLYVRDHGNLKSNTLTLSTVCNDPALTIPTSECTALMDLYNSTD